MAKKTRLGLEGYGVRRAGNFALKTPTWTFLGVSNTVDVVTTSHTLGTTGLPTLQAGDLLIACISSRIASTTPITLPTGGEWSKVGEQNTNNVLTTSSAVATGLMASCVRGASNPNFTFTHPVSPSIAMGRIVAYRRNPVLSPGTVLDVAAAATTAINTTAVSVAGVTTTKPNDLAVAMIAGGQEAAWSNFDATDPGVASGATNTTTQPTVGTWIERADAANSTGADGSLAIFDAIKETAGATGNLTATASIAASHVVIIGTFIAAPLAAVLTADAGSYTLTGTAASLEHGWKIAATTAGAYALTGTAASLEHGWKIAATTAGAYALTGTVTTLKHGWKIAATTAGSYALTGTVQTLRRGVRASIVSGSYALAGTAATLRRGRKLTVTTVGAYALTGATDIFIGVLDEVYLDPMTRSSNIVLSNANLTATQTASATGNVRANAHHVTGKYYHEFTVNTAGDMQVGLSTDDLLLTEYLGENSAVSIGVDDVSGWLGASGTTTAPTLVAGHTYGMAIDLDAGKAWCIDITAGGLWNADASANPVTGVNGAEFFVAYIGPGDLDVGATAWWGLRAYSSDTTGDAALDVVRASDSATTTINTLNDGSLDVASLTTFLAATTGKCSKLYDQTGNGNHLLQATDANRPAITLNAVGSLPALTFNGSTTFMMSSTTVDIWQPYTLAAVVKDRIVAPSGVHCFIGADGGFDVQMCFGNIGYLPDKVFQGAGAGNPSAAAAHDVLHSIFGVFNNFAGSLGSYLVVDGVVTYGSIASGAQFNGHFLLGAAEGPSNVLDGIICEAGFWPYLVTP